MGLFPSIYGKYSSNSKIMPAEDYIEIDHKTESSIEVTNTDIFKKVMQKEEEENT
jgi:hypothetical protein